MIALTEAEVNSKKEYISEIISLNDAFGKVPEGTPPESFVPTALGIAGASNPEVLCSFLSPVKDIITDYRTTGVKMLLSIPTINPPSITGGARRRRTYRRSHRRKAKKSRRSRK